jgi:hypothetical protein
MHVSVDLQYRNCLGVLSPSALILFPLAAVVSSYTVICLPFAAKYRAELLKISSRSLIIYSSTATVRYSQLLLNTVRSVWRDRSRSDNTVKHSGYTVELLNSNGN